MKRNKKTGINIKFQHTNGENYLLKMKKDTLFLSLSPLANYFNFSNKSDPFLVLTSK